MSYNIERNNNTVVVYVNGDFDAILAKDLQSELEKIKNEDIAEVIFDFDNTRHIASSGLRVIIFAEERLNVEKVAIKNAKNIVLEVIKMSGIDAFVTLID